MSQFPLPPLVFIPIVLGIILIILCGLITLTLRLSIRLNKAESPGRKTLILVAFLQILAGTIVVAVLRVMKIGPFAGIGVGMAAAIMTGILGMKWFLHGSWKQTLRLWGVAAAMQLVLMPVCLAVLLLIFMALSFWIYPPIY
jgi:hypothetical protein